MEQGIYRNIIRHVEQSVTQSAKLVTVAAPALTPDIRTVIGDHRYEIIFNGYFPELFADMAPVERKDGEFRIAYWAHCMAIERAWRCSWTDSHSSCGKGGYRQPMLTFYGLDMQSDQRERLLSYDPFLRHTPFHTTHSTRNAASGIERLRCDAHSDQPFPWAASYARFFDYLAFLKKEILVTVTEPDIHQLLQQVGEGHFCDTPEEVAATLGTLHAAFKAGTLNQGKEHSEGFRFYSRRHQTQRLAGMLDTL